MRRTPAALVPLVLLAAACSGSSAGGPSLPAASAFTAGTCRTVATDLLQIARDARRLGKGGNVDGKVLDTLTRAQGVVMQIAPGAEPAYKPALSKLVVSVGLIRLQAGVGSYRVEQGAILQRDAAAAISACTASSTR